LPNLRVTRVTGADGAEISYIQESRKADGSFYAILPAPSELKKEYSLTIEYSGDKVVTKAGNGSFYIDAREAWYPNLNTFSDPALYDLTFRIPKRYHLISVGTLQSESVEEGQNVTHWITPKPVMVAGFNYGDYKKIELHDDKTGYDIAGYYLPDLPDMLAHIPAAQSIAPGAMTKYALDQTRAELQICTYYFGNSPFKTIAITEQPNFAFGQSWPNLVYLPISAYLDSTQRWELFGRIDNSFTAFVQEVTPHEVAHQWWGHTVGWASYHDQWLSEGFAEFSAALFLQQAVGPKWEKDYIEFWTRLRKRILDKNQFGAAPNDAGPLWLGLRLMSPRAQNAYQNVTYPKGAYVLAMLRSLFYSNKDQDKAFIEMMHDFVDTHRDTPASTESFKLIAEKHMPHAIDAENNGRLDWFFREWVYGTEVPHYDLDYQTSPGAAGKTHVHLSITQSQVSDHFIMLVPVFADFGKGFQRLGQLPVVGNATKTYDFDFVDAPKKLELNRFKEILER
jgi:aminopeptidase N